MRTPAGLRFLLSTVLLGALLAGCSSLSPEERAQERTALDAMGEKTLARLLERRPELVPVFDEAVGHAVLDIKITKVPMVGFGGGTGVVVDDRDGRRSYVEVWRLDVGGGMGIRSYKLILAFTDEKLIDRAEKGRWKFEAGAELSAGEASAEGGTGAAASRGFTSYTLAEGGASATVTVRLIRLKPYLR